VRRFCQAEMKKRYAEYFTGFVTRGIRAELSR